MALNSKIAFFQILYKPERNAIINIKKSLEAGFYPIVYLNSVCEELLDEINSLNITVLGSNHNVGIGQAFYDVERFLVENEISYFIYFDQDTIVDSQAWEYIINTYRDEFKLTKDTGMLFYTSSESAWSRKSIVISSGCLFSLEVVRNLGFHDKNYFVEGVDYEFCLRLKAQGYSVKVINIPWIDHFSLQPYFKKNFFGMTFGCRVYGNIRLKDFNNAHVKLFIFTIRNQLYKESLFLLKSFVVFNLSELKSRFILKLVRGY
ncbi:hypothetical protein ACPF4L_002928 [Vibrio cholerae]|uniref:hypothetical protein n=1 Tax=Vibrio cholerae TaxID=666 RepID=UPI00015414E0|nr:hypothetical protein [Vibrio cholerae]EGQ8204313.1 hypothetical protein [Vibrio cholerae]EGR1049237.1 hypothetical protein [Vibrio cholerae]EGR4347949.1 hypothetical protein [Vibrio cholerae]EJP6369798.1 hypothetical protein [Vibrio cholerae]EMA3789048.1 hypothetical protein [Vibrio cholerae]